MDRQEHYPTTVGMVATGLSLHRLNATYRDPRFGTYATLCGRWIKSLSDTKTDWLPPTRLCVLCFGRLGAAYFTPPDRSVIVEFFEQDAFNV